MSLQFKKIYDLSPFINILRHHRVRNLNLSNNRIMWLPDSFSELQLETLDLTGNLIQIDEHLINIIKKTQVKNLKINCDQDQ